MSTKSVTSYSKFITDHSDILILALILTLTVMSYVAKEEWYLRVSLFLMVLNFGNILYASRKDRADERIRHHKHFAAYVTVIVVFLVLALMSVLHKHDIVRGIEMHTYTRLITWVLGFTYALSYSILKRVK
jgi:hypothetical protein